MREKEKRRAMEKKVLAVSGIVGFLGLLSAILGFIANTKRIKVYIHIYIFQ